MRRRSFIGFLGGAVATWPLLAWAQQKPIIGFLHQGTPEPPSLMAAFRKGLVDAGVSDGSSITIENRWANGQYDRLPALAADLVSHRVAIIAACFLPAALAAKAATQTIPIVFLVGSDPIAAGLVSSINRPTNNVTGIAFRFSSLWAKSLELLRELVPNTSVIAALTNPTNPSAEPQLRDLQTAARSLGLELVSFTASNDQEIDSVFPMLQTRKIGALVITTDQYLVDHYDQLISLANRYALPTMYPLRRAVELGGLMSYGANLSDSFQQCGVYVGKILRGAKPSDLPILQPSKYELVINLKTAKTLGLTIPPTLQMLADELIE
jgi:putative ABC transport system substrate-binding protein